jgi:poly(A) polymerase
VAPCPPETLLAQHGDALDIAGQRSVLGLLDTQRLLDEVTRAGASPERFRTLLRTVKAWAKARGIYSHALGYLGGLSWSVLAAWACTRAPREDAGSDVAVLAHFFETFSRWPWPQPVTLTPETARYRPDGKRDLLPVLAPAAPMRNTARNVSRSTFRVLRDELTRAREVVEKARADGTPTSWETLFEPLDLADTMSTRLVLTVDAPTAEAREVAAGWVLGHLTTLVYRLEGNRRIFARPLPPASPEGPFVIGLDARSAPRDAVLETVEEFCQAFYAWEHCPEKAALIVELGP